MQFHEKNDLKYFIKVKDYLSKTELLMQYCG